MGPELNVSKTSVLPKDTTQQVFFDVVHNIINVNPRIDVQNFIAKTCRTITSGFTRPLDSNILTLIF